MRSSTLWALALSLTPIVVTCGASDTRRAVRSHEASEEGTGGGSLETSEAGSGSAAWAADGPAGAGGDIADAGGGTPGGGETGAGAAVGGSAAGGDSTGAGGAPAAAAGAAGVAGEASESAFFHDDFESEALQTGELYTFNHLSFEQWNVVAGNVDITVLPNGYIDHHGGYGSGEPASGTVVDLNGSSNELGVLESKLELELQANLSYTLSYSLGNARPETNVVLVSLSGLVSATHSQPTTAAFTKYQQTFTPVTTVLAKLRFESQGNADQDGLLLDNVTITQNRE
jgi:hypothetical protein